MKKRLTPIGNSLGLVIEKPILELLNIDRETEIEVTTDGKALFITPIRRHRKKDHHRNVMEVAERIMNENESTFRKLADS